MELNKRNLIIFCVFILSVVIVFFIIKNNLSRKSYVTELSGKVESFRYVGKGEGYIEVKFEGEESFNHLCVIYIGGENKESLKIGDSIYKAKNSEEYEIYRKDSSGNYNFYKTLKNKP
ncbi:hypothetical protein IX39_12490 [Chryseobacterium formosense]|uniref:Uncharacterized protein n=1 Tax=Chryseobacterium formosense TaxID=236814 RepID=A0A085ZAB9_9FLAO|nr:hypothetical protein [Chryseobacterium formosense]KFF01383.1 hypothetical protein IX39_12490 [Chryseobacterium formosense]SFT46548.1 hypothetical protein SAMN05421857_1184 [Chryseobacterium formosense]